jgi:hypothetical protein
MKIDEWVALHRVTQQPLFPGQGRCNQVDLNLPARPLARANPEELGFELNPFFSQKDGFRGRKAQSSWAVGIVGEIP